MNIFNGQNNYGPIIDVTELPAVQINKHAIYRLIDQDCTIGDPPCGYYKTTHPNWRMTDDGAYNELSDTIARSVDDIIAMIEAGTYKSDYFDDADLYTDQARAFTITLASDGTHRYFAGTKLNGELVAAEGSIVIDYYVYDIDHWVSIGNAISYVEVLPAVTDPVAATKIFILNTSGGGGVYEVEGVFVLDQKNGEWINLMSGRVIMIDKVTYDSMIPKTDILYVVV